jgi:hypothetical protein
MSEIPLVEVEEIVTELESEAVLDGDKKAFEKMEIARGKTIDPRDPDKTILRGVRGTVKWFSLFNRKLFIELINVVRNFECQIY